MVQCVAPIVVMETNMREFSRVHVVCEVNLTEERLPEHDTISQCFV